MPISSTTAPLANVLDSMTAEGAPELTEHLEAGALKCYACGHRCLIKLGKRPLVSFFRAQVIARCKCVLGVKTDA